MPAVSADHLGIWSLAFTPDGLTLAAAGELPRGGSTVFLHDATPPDPAGD